MSSAGATLQGSYSGETGTISEVGFYYGTTSGSLGSKAVATGTSSPFSKAITGLSAGTTDYYKAYVLEFSEAAGDYVYRYGDESSFTTSAATPEKLGWLELPAISGSEDYVGWFYGSGSTEGTNRNYSYNYSYAWYASLWVAYPLCGTHKTGSASTSSWRYNPNIDNSKQVKIVDNSYPTMYNASAYARGHQCPNASRKSNDQMNLQTYYSTNQTPQLQDKFNGSIWGSLEGAVRGLVSSATDTVYVVTGPAYRKAGGSESITYLTGTQSANPASLPVPNYYWKAILKVKRDGSGNLSSASAIGFWFDHREYNKDTEHYYDFTVSVDQIEAWTGFDLFANLPVALQTTAEANTSLDSFRDF